MRIFRIKCAECIYHREKEGSYCHRKILHLFLDVNFSIVSFDFLILLSLGCTMNDCESSEHQSKFKTRPC